MLHNKISREYPPIPLISVGVLLYDKKTNRILLIKRGNPPGKGKYSIPGGLVELGESLKEAAIREVKEETSIDCRILGIIHIDEIIVRDEHNRVRWHYVLIDFLGEPLTLNAKPSSDAKSAIWVGIDEALRMNLTSSARRLIEKISRCILDRNLEKILLT